MSNKLRLSIILPLINVLLAGGLIYLGNQIHYEKFKYDIPPLPFPTQLCLGIQAPAYLVFIFIDSGGHWIGFWLPERWTLFLMCVGGFWCLIGHRLDKGRSHSRKPYAYLSVPLLAIVGALLLRLAVEPLRGVEALPRVGIRWAIQTGAIGGFVQGSLDIVWAALFLSISAIQARKLWASRRVAEPSR